VITVTTIRERLTEAGRVVDVVRRQPGWVTRAALWAGVIAMGAVAILLVVPAIIIMLLVFFAGAAVARVRSFFVRAQQPNGLLDGRKNVRVIERAED
jgi:hypothetical protein